MHSPFRLLLCEKEGGRSLWEGVDFYSIGEDQFKKIAIEAGAFFKFAKSTIVCREDFEKYIKDHYKVKRRSPEDY